MALKSSSDSLARMKLLAILLLLVTLPALAERHGIYSYHSHTRKAAPTRPYYGGGKHTESHGGTYRGSYAGSTHKNGHYTSPNGTRRYGRHK